MKERNPTTAAVRSATALYGKWTGEGKNACWTVDASVVIDHMTGLPELLAACEMARDWIGSLRQWTCRGQTMDEVLRKLDAAITRSKGGRHAN